jgi:hypothetical protein
MSMICDACGEKYGHDDGSATLHTSPPSPNFMLYQAFAAAGQTYTPKKALMLDLCLACTKSVLAHLGLPTDSCEPPQLPHSDEIKRSERPLTGQLSEEELRKLGMTDDDLRQLGLGPKVES